jgi:hypothetical protein
MSKSQSRTERNTKTPSELIAEFGSVSLKRIARSAAPSIEDLDRLAKLTEEMKELREAIPTLPDVARPFAQRALESLQVQHAMYSASLANPANLAGDDTRKLVVAAKRLLRTNKANIVSVAQFVLDNVEVFPVVGTKY